MSILITLLGIFVLLVAILMFKDIVQKG